jgi:hypothetical protein
MRSSDTQSPPSSPPLSLPLPAFPHQIDGMDGGRGPNLHHCFFSASGIWFQFGLVSTLLGRDLVYDVRHIRGYMFGVLTLVSIYTLLGYCHGFGLGLGFGSDGVFGLVLLCESKPGLALARDRHQIGIEWGCMSGHGQAGRRARTYIGRMIVQWYILCHLRVCKVNQFSIKHLLWRHR